jgi:hypothetical protein
VLGGRSHRRSGWPENAGESKVSSRESSRARLRWPAINGANTASLRSLRFPEPGPALPRMKYGHQARAFGVARGHQVPMPGEELGVDPAKEVVFCADTRFVSQKLAKRSKNPLPWVLISGDWCYETSWQRGKEIEVKGPSSRPRVLICPHCEAGVQINALADALGRHACECGHPEMRRLPDGVFHCPACGSEVIGPSNFADREERLCFLDPHQNR